MGADHARIPEDRHHQGSIAGAKIAATLPFSEVTPVTVTGTSAPPPSGTVTSAGWVQSPEGVHVVSQVPVATRIQFSRGWSIRTSRT